MVRGVGASAPKKRTADVYQWSSLAYLKCTSSKVIFEWVKK